MFVLSILETTIHFFAKQASRILHRIPRPSHSGFNVGYKIASDILRKNIGKDDFVLCITKLRATNYPYFSYFKILCVDISIQNGVNIQADAHYLPFKCNKFKGIILENAMQCLKAPHVVANEIKRVLANDGLAYLCVPFTQEDHPAPVDFWRFSQHGIRELFKELKEVELGIAAGPFVALFDIILSIAKNFTDDRDFNYCLWYLAVLVFYPLNIADMLFARNKRLLAASASIYYIGQKA